MLWATLSGSAIWKGLCGKVRSSSWGLRDLMSAICYLLGMAVSHQILLQRFVTAECPLAEPPPPPVHRLSMAGNARGQMRYYPFIVCLGNTSTGRVWDRVYEVEKEVALIVDLLQPQDLVPVCAHLPMLVGH